MSEECIHNFSIPITKTANCIRDSGQTSACDKCGISAVYYKWWITTNYYKIWQYRKGIT